MAVEQVVAQLRAQLALPDYARAPMLGLVYITDLYALDAARILERLAADLPGVADWAGATGVGVCAPATQYLYEPALSVMLCDLPCDQYRVYSGVAPLPPQPRFHPQMALVHADGETPDLADLINELAGRTGRGYLFGGLTATRGQTAPQFAWSRKTQNGWPGGPGSVLHGGLSGVAFERGVTLASRVAQGCRPVTPERLITAAEGNLVLTLEDKAALDVLIDDLASQATFPNQAQVIWGQTLAGLANPGEDGVRRTGDFGPGVQVRSLLGFDARRRAVLVTDNVSAGQRLALCRRDAQTARNDLVRVCAEIREALEPRQILATGGGVEVSEVASPRIMGAHYVTCAARSGPYPGALKTDLDIIRQALGDVPLTGFFGNGEISYRYRYGYTGVLTVFAENPDAMA
jgi:small ligand-binding sensory domain FIST